MPKIHKNKIRNMGIFPIRGTASETEKSHAKDF